MLFYYFNYLSVDGHYSILNLKKHKNVCKFVCFTDIETRFDINTANLHQHELNTVPT